MASKKTASSSILAGVGDLSSFLDQDDVQGKPMLVAKDKISPDANQPRKPDNPGFSTESIKELAATIKLRGLKTPISVREDTANPGHYIINHGERRFLACGVAGLDSIPCYLDNDYSDDDQVIENIQRSDLTPREIAEYIGRKLAEGLNKSEVAKKLGKSPAFVTQHSTLLDLPFCIAEAFRDGTIRDLTVVNELVTAFKTNPEDVEAFLAENTGEDITRSAVKIFREYLEEKSQRDQTPAAELTPDDLIEGGDKAGEDDSNDDGESGDNNDVTDSIRKSQESESDPLKMKKTIVIVEYLGEQGRLILNKRPSAEGEAWIKFDNGSEEELNLENVKIVCLMEG
ncbi:ParB/RepB/Spo0J family partition protein [Pantoea agglomerans]|uniref:ParB/RepB/Spo0J family partition protein n=1 Tax=Enterobacter agglomerans TaxID=549 RepID=UPI00320900EB